MKNATMINRAIPLYPTFPLRCVACPARHDGNIDRAIDDGWHVIVYDTRSQGHVQFAGCPVHFSEFEGESLAFLKEKTHTRHSAENR